MRKNLVKINQRHQFLVVLCGLEYF